MGKAAGAFLNRSRQTDRGGEDQGIGFKTYRICCSVTSRTFLLTCRFEKKNRVSTIATDRDFVAEQQQPRALPACLPACSLTRPPSDTKPRNSRRAFCRAKETVINRAKEPETDEERRSEGRVDFCRDNASRDCVLDRATGLRYEVGRCWILVGKACGKKWVFVTR